MPEIKSASELTTIIYEKKDHIAHIRLNRPDILNAMNEQMMYDQLFCWDDVNRDDDVWAVVLSGAGRAFCSGADISAGASRRVSAVRNIPGLHYGSIQCFKPIICAVNGYCLGQGASLAMMADIRICSEDARIGYSHVKNGFASVGGPTLLPRSIARGMACYYLLTGELMDSKEAYRLGWAVKVAPNEKLMDEAFNIARKIAENAPIATRCTKETYTRQWGLPLHEGFRIAQNSIYPIIFSEDLKEGGRASREKRKPQYKNK